MAFTCEFSVGILADVCSQPRPRKVERVHNEQGPSARQTARSHVDRKELPEVRLGIVAREHVLDGVFECEIERLRREIPRSMSGETIIKGCHGIAPACGRTRRYHRHRTTAHGSPDDVGEVAAPEGRHTCNRMIRW